MVKLWGLIIDEFTVKDVHSPYFLTHWHSDHYFGLTKTFNYKQIYASLQTIAFLLIDYPNLCNIVHPLSLYEPTDIQTSFGKVQVTAFDANHICGSLIFVFSFQQTYCLYTGDMRSSLQFIRNSPLFVSSKQLSILQTSNYSLSRLHDIKHCGQLKHQTKDLICRYRIDTLYLDNTYCDPLFKFPSRSKAIRTLINLINNQKPSHVFLCTDSIGKQEAFVCLAKYFGTKLAVNESRLAYIKCMPLPDCFVLRGSDQSESCLFTVLRKNQLTTHLSMRKGSIGVTLTGWANVDCFAVNGTRSYVIPYSLHSNFHQLQQFVSIVKPNKILPIVKPKQNSFHSFPKSNSFQSYMFSLINIQQRGLQFLRKMYCSLSNQQNNNQQNDNHYNSQ